MSVEARMIHGEHRKRATVTATVRWSARRRCTGEGDWGSDFFCVALVSHHLLGERLGVIQVDGFALLADAMVLIMYHPTAS
jgi:hypothetical protein